MVYQTNFDIVMIFETILNLINLIFSSLEEWYDINH